MKKALDITKPRYSSEQTLPVTRPFVITSFHCIFVIYESFFFLHVFVQVLSTKQIDLTSMAGVYVVLGVGLVVAYLVLIAEIIWKRKQEMRVEGQLATIKILISCFLPE